MLTFKQHLNELSKKTLGSYVKKASDRRSKDSYRMSFTDTKKSKPGSESRHRKGIERAVDKLAKEETLDEGVGHYSVHKIGSHDVEHEEGSTRHTQYEIHHKGKKVGELKHEDYFGTVHGHLHGKDLPDISGYSRYNNSGVLGHLHSFLKSKTGAKWSSNLHNVNEETLDEAPIGHIKKGAMHADLGEPESHKITSSDIAKEKAKGGVYKKRAIFAQNAKKWHHEETEQVDEAVKEPCAHCGKGYESHNFHYQNDNKKPSCPAKGKEYGKTYFKAAKPFRDAAATGSKRDFAKEETIVEEHEMSDAAHELVLHADNSAQLHHGSHMPIINNLKKKMKKGVYDSEKAKKLWGYHADRAAQDYHKQYGAKHVPWHHMFSTHDRKQAAAHWEAHHRDELHEEIEHLDELSKKTLVSYVKKSSRDRADTGLKQGIDMATKKGQAGRDADTAHNKRDNKRAVGIHRAVHKLAKEETLDEVGDTIKGRMKLRSYVKKSGEDEKETHLASQHLSLGNDDKRIEKRIIGQGRAIFRIAKKGPGFKKEEVVDESGLIGSGIIGGLAGAAIGGKGAYHAARYAAQHGKTSHLVKSYAKKFVKGMIDPRTYIPGKKQKADY